MSVALPLPPAAPSVPDDPFQPAVQTLDTPHRHRYVEDTSTGHMVNGKRVQVLHECACGKSVLR